jgi:hypothetical protein
MRDAFTQAVLEYLARPDRLADQLAMLEQVRLATLERNDGGVVTDGKWLTSVC